MHYGSDHELLIAKFRLKLKKVGKTTRPFKYDLSQIPNDYMQYCSLQHQTLLISPVTSTAGYCFCFGSIPSFSLELFLHWSPVAYWAPTDLIPLSVSYHFAFSYYSRGSQGKNTEVVCHSLLQWTHSVRPLHLSDLSICHSILGGPTGHGLVSLS